MNKTWPYILLFVFSVFISSISQIILKKSANKTHKNRLAEYLNVYVVGAYGLFFTSTLLTILAFKHISLSFGPILESLGYIFVLVMGSLFLNEKIKRNHLIGFLFIITGVIIYTVGKS